MTKKEYYKLSEEEWTVIERILKDPEVTENSAILKLSDQIEGCSLVDAQKLYNKFKDKYK